VTDLAKVRLLGLKALEQGLTHPAFNLEKRTWLLVRAFIAQVERVHGHRVAVKRRPGDPVQLMSSWARAADELPRSRSLPIWMRLSPRRRCRTKARSREEPDMRCGTSRACVPILNGCPVLTGSGRAYYPYLDCERLSVDPSTPRRGDRSRKRLDMRRGKSFEDIA
jgi:hypothetical protein